MRDGRERSKIDNLAFAFIKNLKNQQDKKRLADKKEKNNQQRILVCGAHEVLKFVQSGKIKVVFYAKNLDENNNRAASNFHSLQKLCPNENVPMIQVLTRKEMSRVVNKFPYVGVIGVFNFHGFENEAKEIIQEWRTSSSFKQFHTDQSSLLP
ncbi:hypothetical protein B9Z55_001524 [Caenorhabditis nigoni]|uniref:Ribosomal protein eL8/eL30/eS12/Gadd45 domain-containing protein n=1 Tax=Caenorhabditis nigoni TaxID=1611254 RepID=A0A2G5VG48_9PELO|nr:hypothetical protein B9Z55_001524 [Caenorhabditis nigoni]